MRSIIIIFFVCFSLSMFSQVKGKVIDQYNNPLEMVDIVIRNTKKGTFTDKKGEFSFNLEDGSYTLIASFVGFKSKQKTVIVKNGVSKNIFFKLEEDAQNIEEVVVKAKTKSQIVKEKPFAVESIKMKGIKNLSTNANAVLNKVSGVNIRRTGGLGSSYSFSMNGLSGKQVKFFIDEIPLDNLGSSLSLDNFPVNLIDRIDVFKGVVPVYLGADALGGAVNIVTNQRKSNYFDVSYSFGSFNTHIFSLLGRYQDEKTGFIAKILTFHNYSDNNYEIDNIDVTDELGNIEGKVNDIERNHDAYHSAMINLQLGVANKSFADELLVGTMFSKNENELQHSYDFQKPFGEVEVSEELKQFSLTYKKKNILKNLDVKMYGSLSKNVIQFKDTSSYIYYWLKDKKLSNNKSKGEFGAKRLSTFDDDIRFINTSLKYNLVEKHNIVFNYANSYFERIGRDDIPKAFVPFQNPHSVDKNVLGLAYNFKLFNNKFATSVFTKYYLLNIKGLVVDSFKDEKDPEKIKNIDNKFNELGYGLATTYKLFNNIQLKASFENALRLPDGAEVFGDGALTESNVELQPEKSININFGGIYKTKISEDLKLHFDANGFYRKAENLIVLQPKIITRVYINSYDAEILGIEGALNLNYRDILELKMNMTKQNIDEVLDGQKIKIPNIPLLFGNVSLGYNLKDIFTSKDRLGLLLSTRYIDGFPVYSYTSGNSEKPTLESQISQNFNISYSLNSKYNISFSINNLWDKSLYDNFNIQQPGRAFYMKLRYSI